MHMFISEKVFSKTYWMNLPLPLESYFLNDAYRDLEKEQMLKFCRWFYILLISEVRLENVQRLVTVHTVTVLGQ